MACCHLYQAGYGCDCREPWMDEPEPQVGEFVRIINAAEKDFPFEYGVVVAVDEIKGGCFVRPLDPDAHVTQIFGWSWEELEVVSRIPPPPKTRFERELVV